MGVGDRRFVVWTGKYWGSSGRLGKTGSVNLGYAELGRALEPANAYTHECSSAREKPPVPSLLVVDELVRAYICMLGVLFQYLLSTYLK